MKLSSVVCASILALAATAFVAGEASAATINTTKSNTFKIGTEAGTTEADCTKQGGKVELGKDGAKRCTIASSSSRTICLIYKPGHQGDDRYCSQSVPAPQ
jgi:hypothetical protein